MGQQSNVLKTLSKKRKLTVQLLALFLPTLFLLVLIEAGARLYVHFSYGVEGKSYGLWRYDEVLGARHRENAYNSHTQTNDHGFRNRENVIEPKPEKALRIITYGGSTTFCYNLSDDEAWPSRLQQYLRDKSANNQHQVLNAGAIMWSIGHAYARAQQEIPKLKPDYVVIYSGINEYNNNYYLEVQGRPIESWLEENVYGRFATNMDQNRWVKRNLVIVRIFEYRLLPWLLQFLPRPNAEIEFEIPDSADPAVLENYLHVLEDFIELIIANGGRAIFVPQIHDQKSEWNRYLTSYSQHGIEIAKTMGATVIDSNKIIENYSGDPSDLFYNTGRHLSPLGAQMFSAYIVTELF